MENLYSNAILNLINAYSQRISKYASALDKVNSIDVTLLQEIDINKTHLVTKLSDIVNINIEILNILRETYTKENNMFTLNRGLVNKINEGMKLSVEGLKPTIEGLKPSVEGLKPTTEGLNVTNEGLKLTNEGLKSSNEGLNVSNERNKPTNDFLTEIVDILSNSLYILEPKSEEPPPPKQTPEEIRGKIIQSPGILREPFIEYFKGKFKFDIIPIRLAFIMEDIYKNSTTTQMHIKSVLRSTYTTTERAFSELRKRGWIKLESSRRKEKYILTEKGKAFIEKIVNGL